MKLRTMTEPDAVLGHSNSRQHATLRSFYLDSCDHACTLQFRRPFRSLAAFPKLFDNQPIMRRPSPLQNPIDRLRIIGLIEGASFLVLLGIAMPLKYFADMPMPVKIAGWLHGVLFIAFCTALVPAKRAAAWGFRQAAGTVLAALLPFGPFVLDRWLKREDERIANRAS